MDRERKDRRQRRRQTDRKYELCPSECALRFPVLLKTQSLILGTVSSDSHKVTLRSGSIQDCSCNLDALPLGQSPHHWPHSHTMALNGVQVGGRAPGFKSQHCSSPHETDLHGFLPPGLKWGPCSITEFSRAGGWGQWCRRDPSALSVGTTQRHNQASPLKHALRSSSYFCVRYLMISADTTFTPARSSTFISHQIPTAASGWS